MLPFLDSRHRVLPEASLISPVPLIDPKPTSNLFFIKVSDFSTNIILQPFYIIQTIQSFSIVIRLIYKIYMFAPALYHFLFMPNLPILSLLLLLSSSCTVLLTVDFLYLFFNFLNKMKYSSCHSKHSSLFLECPSSICHLATSSRFHFSNRPNLTLKFCS